MRNFKWLFILPLLMVGSLASAQTPLITFDGQWYEWSSPSPLKKGTTATINYDANRLSQCRGTTNTGGPAWTITGYYQFNGGTVQSFWVAGHSPSGSTQQPTLSLSQSGTLTMWFQVTNLWGCTAWDSDYGANYNFAVVN